MVQEAGGSNPLSHPIFSDPASSYPPLGLLTPMRPREPPGTTGNRREPPGGGFFVPVMPPAFLLSGDTPGLAAPSFARRSGLREGGSPGAF